MELIDELLIKGNDMKKDLFIDMANITFGIFAIFCFGVVFLPKVQNYIP